MVGAGSYVSKSNAFETDILKYIFNAIDVAALGTFYISLHMANPGETGDQTTSEANYTPYARQAVLRDATGWTVTGNTANPTAVITFPRCTNGSNVITHFGIGNALNGAGYLFFYGTVSPNLTVVTGQTPLLMTTSSITED